MIPLWNRYRNLCSSTFLVCMICSNSMVKPLALTSGMSMHPFLPYLSSMRCMSMDPIPSNLSIQRCQTISLGKIGFCQVVYSTMPQVLSISIMIIRPHWHINGNNSAGPLQLWILLSMIMNTGNASLGHGRHTLALDEDWIKM